MNPIQFYTSVDVTLSEKLLEVMYCLIGLISIYVAFFLFLQAEASPGVSGKETAS